MRKIRVTENQSFSIHIEKKIEEESFFFHEYEMAVEHLNHIWNIQTASRQGQDDLFIEDANNIVAFCGERGSGKSSVMLSFINALQQSGKQEDELKFSDSVRNNNWNSKVIIDPSVFDGVHNIVDIVLAHIFQSFRDACQEDNQRFDQYERERLYKLMAKVYKNLSIIKNKEKMLDDEYDEAGNIAKLQKLGESTQLRKTLSELIKVYLEIISEVKCRQGQKCEKLLIAIDDLDLCNEYAYEMAEQIRKYLILPNVIIFMAIKIDQLKLGIEEKNRKDFKNVLARNSGSAELEYEMSDMSQKYLTKLIPTARRISLPDLNNTEFCLVIDDDNYLSGRGVEEVILKMIRKKTGMIFEATPKNTYHYFVPENLREFVNFIIFLRGLENPGNAEELYVQNLRDFERYFINEIVETHIKKERFNNLKEVLDCDSNTTNYNMWLYLNKLLLDHLKNNNAIQRGEYEYQYTSFAAVLDSLNNMAIYLTKKEDYQLSYYLKIYYTIILNQEFRKNKGKFPYELTGGFIWGNRINTIMPTSRLNNGGYLSRGRFFADIKECWDIIYKEISKVSPFTDNEIIQPFSQNKNNMLYVKNIEKRKKWRMASAWILMAMTVSVVNFGADGRRYVYDQNIIYDNYLVFSVMVSPSIENYFGALCTVKKTVEKVNLQLLGLNSEDVEKITQKLMKKNIKQIKMAQVIALNPDLSTKLLEYCCKNGDFKDSGKETRTYQLYKRFFENVKRFFKEKYFEEVDMSKLWIPIEESDTDIDDLSGVEIDICRIFEEMYEKQKNILDLQNSNVLEAQKIKQDFSAKVTFISHDEYVGKIKAIPETLRNRKAGWVKAKLEDMASVIQNYTYKNKVYPIGYDSNELIKLYSDVVDLYMQDPDSKISDDQYNTYQKVAQIIKQNALI